MEQLKGGDGIITLTIDITKNITDDGFFGHELENISKKEVECGDKDGEEKFFLYGITSMSALHVKQNKCQTAKNTI